MRRLQWVAIFGVTAGCGGIEAAPPKSAVTITYLQSDNPPYMKADEEAFAAYTAAHPSVTIANNAIRYPHLTARLLAELSTGNLRVDLVRLPPSWVCSFADQLADVPDDVITLAQAREVYFAAPLAGSTCNGKLKGLPIEYNLEYGGVVVNVDKYQTRFPGQTPGWNDWSTFISQASALTEYDRAGKPCANGLDIAPDWPQPVKHIFFSQILQRGGSYWSSRGDRFDFRSPAAHDALTEMVGWVTRDRVMFPSLIPDDNTFVTTRLVLGAAGYGCDDPAAPLSVMGYAGTWAVPNTVGQLPSGKNTRYDFYPLPPMVGTQHKFVQNSGFALAVPRSSKNPAVAWDIARSIALDPDAARKWTTTGGALPALKVNGTPEAAASSPMLAKVQPLLEQGQWVGYIPAAAIETVEGAMMANFFHAATGKKPIPEALADMERAANEALGKNH
jgi:multiple sugar transport system substrate-binding protein